jgi:hypothetical protein
MAHASARTDPDRDRWQRPRAAGGRAGRANPACRLVRAGREELRQCDTDNSDDAHRYCEYGRAVEWRKVNWFLRANRTERDSARPE